VDSGGAVPAPNSGDGTVAAGASVGAAADPTAVGSAIAAGGAAGVVSRSTTAILGASLRMSSLVVGCAGEVALDVGVIGTTGVAASADTRATGVSCLGTGAISEKSLSV
jgi:hypothetical protein